MKKQSKFDKVCIKLNELYNELNPSLMLLIFIILFAMIPTGLKYTMNFKGELELTSKFGIILVAATLTFCKLLCVGAIVGRGIGNKKTR